MSVIEHFVCYVCQVHTPRAFGHLHHKIPEAAGGTDKDIVLICNADHMNIHSIAYMLLNPKRVQEIDSALHYYKDNGARARIAELANLVALEMSLKADGKIIENEKKSLMIELSVHDHQRLMLAARDRKTSMVKYAEQVICKHLDHII